MEKIILWIFKILFGFFIIGMIVDGILNELKDPGLDFYISCAVFMLIPLSIFISNVYGILGGDARNAKNHISSCLNELQENYRLLYYSLTALRADLYTNDEPKLAIAHANNIVKSYNALKRWYSDKALRKYLTEEDKAMYSKKIDTEIKKIEAIINSIEYTYSNKMTALTEDIEQKRIYKVAKAVTKELLELTHTAYFNVKITDSNLREYNLPAEVLITTKYNIRTTEDAKFMPNKISNMDYRIIRVFYPSGGYKWFNAKDNSFSPGETKKLVQTDIDGNIKLPKKEYTITLLHDLTQPEVICDRIIKKLESDKSKMEKKLTKIQNAILPKNHKE